MLCYVTLILKYFRLAAGNLICAIYTLIFLKLWSYVQVNYWCRTSLRGKATGTTYDRQQAGNRMKSMVEIDTNPPKSKLIFQYFSRFT